MNVIEEKTEALLIVEKNQFLTLTTTMQLLILHLLLM